MSLRILALSGAAALALGGAALAQTGDEPEPGRQRPTTVSPVSVTGERRDDTPAKLNHILPEVEGAKVTVTKKTTVTKLEQQPTVIDNNQRELFVRSPGVLVTEQQTPTQFNFSYRGLGNPQESEYVLVLQDGLPISTDWIGFPTLYYTPLAQSVREIELIRGGSSLLYGPEPAPAINFVSKRPRFGEPLTGYTEQVAGEHGLYSTFNVLEGSSGPWAFRADYGYVRSNGQRQNAASHVDQGDLYIAYQPDPTQVWGLDLHAYEADSGDPGRISYPQFLANPSYSPTPYNYDWVSRFSAVLHHEQDFSGGWRFEGKLWAAYQDLASRAATAQAPGAAPPATTTLQDELFRSEGLDLRLRDRWGRGNAFTVGMVLYHDDAPFRQWTDTDLLADRDDRTGTPRLRQARNSYYGSIFAENVFRLPGRFHIVPSVRLEGERLTVDETVKPPSLKRPLQDVGVNRSVPLFGLGIGNDFGHQNETYFNVSQGYRPLRFYDVASPFSNLRTVSIADPSRSLSWEAGVHGTPVRGLFYDADLFWIDFKNRIESVSCAVQPSPYYNSACGPNDVVDVNTGDTRHRGLEGELSYDFLEARGATRQHLVLFGNVSLLDARFTSSSLPTQVGRVPAFAPHYLFKAGLTWREEGRYKLSLTGVSVGSQYFQDSDLPAGAGSTYVPAKVPAYTVLDFAGDVNLTRRWRLLGGVSNLADKKYYSRVFQNGIEPAPGRTIYGGLALGF